ncbi:MAG: NAD(P)-dependent oxidoreductase [Rhodovulum sulfidophilum]|uniref:NAD(P)-dependent oxidoreductase n=1 Tax=Rhodovulum sulfidophilum TaxID=35806 RepID=A0A2W5MXM2_RHOSU|nr:MAG: NAD(P)-dependent oxidoreductase [Rhodovulum sulfidophilum]
MPDALTTPAPAPSSLASLPLDGRSAVVTGAASGLGLAYVEALCEAGARVTLTDLEEARLREQAERLRGLGYDVQAEAADVTDAARADAIMAGVAARHGGVDIFFANAGIDPGPGYAALDAEGRRSDANRLENYDFARWGRVVDISLNAVFLGLRAAARQMRPRGRGSIVVTTSISALRPAPGLGAAYAAAKAGAAQLVRAAAIELAPDGVRVNAIAPGPFITNIGDGFINDPEVQRRFAQGVPMGRMARPEEIKPLALYLASDASAFVTGQQIAIDGGMSLLAARF